MFLPCFCFRLAYLGEMVNPDVGVGFLMKKPAKVLNHFGRRLSQKNRMK